MSTLWQVRNKDKIHTTLLLRVDWLFVYSLSLNRGLLVPQQPLQKPSSRVPWRRGDAAVDRGNSGWKTSKVWKLFAMLEPFTMAFHRKDGRASLLSRPPCPFGDPVGRGTELNWKATLQKLFTLPCCIMVVVCFVLFCFVCLFFVVVLVFQVF